jgi:hypothetical protein
MSDKSSKTRTRAHSTASLTEYYKRKREVNNTEDETEINIQQLDVFKKSKTIARTPPKGKEITNKAKQHSQNIQNEESLKGNKREDMDKIILEEIQKMRTEMRDGFEENKKDIKKLQEEMTRKENEWKIEKQELSERIGMLEGIMEAQEKQRKKNNIIIKGLKSDNDQHIKEKVEEFLAKEVGVTVSVMEAYKIGKNEERKAIIAKIQTWEQKRDIMVNKKILKGKKIIIDNDLTRKEMNIQNKLREIAKEEESTGSKTKMGYQKITINNKMYVWNHKDNQLEYKGERQAKND